MRMSVHIKYIKAYTNVIQLSLPEGCTNYKFHEIKYPQN